MIRRVVFISIFLICSLTVSAMGEKKDFQAAKLLLFDKKWKEAYKALEKFRKNYPEGRNSVLALFYLARCNEELGNLYRAFDYYSQYLKKGSNRSIKEEAKIGLMDAAFSISSKSDRGYIKYIEKYLKSSNQQAQYYAAFKLSYFKDKAVARKGAPVLKDIIIENGDEELVERARIALMRIDPSYLKDKKLIRTDSEYSLIKIEIYDKVKKETTLSVSFPLALGKLMLDALEEDNRRKIFRGESVNAFLEKLMESGEMIKMDSNTDIIRVWLE